MSVAAFFYNHGQVSVVTTMRTGALPPSLPPVHQSHVDHSPQGELCHANPLPAESSALFHHQVLRPHPLLPWRCYLLRRRTCSWGLWSVLVTSTLAFLLPWQFSQFTLLTQVSWYILIHPSPHLSLSPPPSLSLSPPPSLKVLSVLVVHCLRLIPSQKFLQILAAMAVSWPPISPSPSLPLPLSLSSPSLQLAFALNVVLQFGNTMLLTSFLPSCLLTCTVS